MRFDILFIKLHRKSFKLIDEYEKFVMLERAIERAIAFLKSKKKHFLNSKQNKTISKTQEEDRDQNLCQKIQKVVENPCKVVLLSPLMVPTH